MQYAPIVRGVSAQFLLAALLIIASLPVGAVTVRSGAFTYSIQPRPAWVTSNALPGSSAAARDGDPIRYRLADTQTFVDAKTEHDYQRVVLVPLNAAGVDKAGQINIRFDPTYQQLTLHNIEVIRNGRRIGKLNKDRIKLLQREQNLEHATYDGTVTMSIVLEDIRVSDVLDYDYTISGSNPIFGNKFARVISLGYEVPVDKRNVRITYPAGRKFLTKMFNASDEPVSAGNGATQVLSWSKENLPAVRNEDRVPRRLQPFPVLQVSEYQSWQDVNQWAEGLFLKPTDLSPELITKIEELRKQQKTPEETVQAALDFIQKEIRYVAIEIGASSHRPTHPNRVLAQRFGDCKDKALLLVTVLERLGIKANVSLVSVGMREGIEDWLPAPTVFDHAITRVVIDKNTFWLDPTRSFQVGSISQRSDPWLGRALVVGEPDGALSAMAYPEGYRYDSLVRQTFVVESFSEPVKLKTETTYRGFYAERIRALFAGKSSDELGRIFLDDLLKSYRGARRVGELTLTDNAPANEVTLSESYLIDDFFTYKKGYLVAGIQGAPLFAPAVRLPQVIKRTSALELPKPFRVEQTVSIELPEDVIGGFAKEGVRVNDPHLRFVATNEKKSKRNLSLEFDLEVLSDTVWPDEMPKFTDNLRTIHNALYVPFVHQAVELGSYRQNPLKLIFVSPAAQLDNAHAAAERELTLAIESGKLPKTQLADVYSERAIERSYQDKKDEALADLEKALALSPTKASAFITRAEIYTGLGRYDDAMQDFERAAKLNQNQERLYYSRGQTNYLKDNFRAARADFLKSLEASNRDRLTYSLLWLHLSAAHLGEGKSMLSRYRSRVELQKWPGPIVSLFEDSLTPDAVLKRAQDGDAARTLQNECEAQFFIGEYYLLKGDVAKAKAAFQAARDTDVKQFLEYVFAGRELEKLSGEHGVRTD